MPPWILKISILVKVLERNSVFLLGGSMQSRGECQSAIIELLLVLSSIELLMLISKVFKDIEPRLS